MQVSFGGTVDDHGAVFHVAHQVRLGLRRECGHDDVGGLEICFPVFRPGLRMDHERGGPDPHQHTLQRNADARRAIADRHGRTQCWASRGNMFLISPCWCSRVRIAFAVQGTTPSYFSSSSTVLMFSAMRPVLSTVSPSMSFSG